MWKKILLITILSNFLSGCALFSIFDTTDAGTVDSEGALVCKVPYDFESPEAVTMRDVKFYVLTPEKMKSIVEGNPEELPEVYYGLSIDGYESMSYNMLEINRFLEANKILIQELRNYYKAEEESEDEEESEKKIQTDR